MKSQRIYIFCILLVFGFILAGCDNPTGGGGDDSTWSKITSLSQLDGTWKGSATQTMTIRQFAEEGGNTWNSQMSATFGNMFVTIFVDMDVTISIDSENAGTAAATTKMNMTFSGGNINSVWSNISNSYKSEGGYTVNDSNHSISGEDNKGPDSVTIDDFDDIWINEDGTQIKSYNLNESFLKVIILTKKLPQTETVTDTIF